MTDATTWLSTKCRTRLRNPFSLRSLHCIEWTTAWSSRTLMWLRCFHAYPLTIFQWKRRDLMPACGQALILKGIPTSNLTSVPPLSPWRRNSWTSILEFSSGLEEGTNWGDSHQPGGASSSLANIRSSCLHTWLSLKSFSNSSSRNVMQYTLKEFPNMQAPKLKASLTVSLVEIAEEM